jgi:hypothetical protein
VVPIGGHFVQVYVSCVSRLQLTEIYQAPPHSTTPLSQSDIHLLILTSLPKDVKQKHKTQYLQQPKLTINPLNHASKYKKPKAQKLKKELTKLHTIDTITIASPNSPYSNLSKTNPQKTHP